MSQFGNLRHIVDLETFLGYSLSLIDYSSITDETITYSWGDESELISWIRSKDKEVQYGGNFYTISGSDKTPIDKRKKYPLVWLVTPVKGVNATDIKNFDNVTIIICTNTEEQWLNATRWKKKMPMLQAIANEIIDRLRGSIRIKRDEGILQYSYRNLPKFAVTEKGGSDDKTATLDLWDAVVITVDLLVDDSCKDDAYFEFCNN
jgi:hypothetical protein